MGRWGGCEAIDHEVNLKKKIKVKLSIIKNLKYDEGTHDILNILD